MFPNTATRRSLMPSGNAVQSAIEPFIRWRVFILNVRSSGLLLWNQGARGRRHPRLVPKSLFVALRTDDRLPGGSQTGDNQFKMTVRQVRLSTAGAPMTINFESQG